MDNYIKLKNTFQEVERLRVKAEKTNDLIIDSLESTLTDLRAANYVIHLYAEMATDLGKIIKLQRELTYNEAP